MSASLEFHPVFVASRAPKVLALGVGGALLSTALLLAGVALGDGQVAYVFRRGELTVETGSILDGQRQFASSSVTDLRTVQLSKGRRLRGTAARGVCTGRFWYPETGEVWQATNCAGTALLLIVAGEKLPILVTPPDFQAFALRLTEPEDGRIALPPGKVGALRLVQPIGSSFRFRA